MLSKTVPLRSLASACDGRLLRRLAAAASLGLLFAGCIADTAEDSDLPWASNKNWEGIAPISPTIMDRYE